MNFLLGYMARRILGVVAVGLQWRDTQREARRTIRRARRHTQARRFTPQPGEIPSPTPRTALETPHRSFHESAG